MTVLIHYIKILVSVNLIDNLIRLNILSRDHIAPANQKLRQNLAGAKLISL